MILLAYGWLIAKLNEWMKGWMNEWMNEWMKGWMNEWMNEWIYLTGGWYEWRLSRSLSSSLLRGDGGWRGGGDCSTGDRAS